MTKHLAFWDRIIYQIAGGDADRVKHVDENWTRTEIANCYMMQRYNE